jgi:hypothetical protein
MSRKSIVGFFLIYFLFLACGLEEYYYLPQVPDFFITRTSNTEAVINIPSIEQFYYSANYVIYYRIYVSGENITSNITGELLNLISPDLARDFNAINPSTDPTNITATTSVNTLFRNRGFFELDLQNADINEVLSKRGGNLRIWFPTAQGDFPTASFNNGPEIPLQRSRDLISPLPTGDLSFRNTPELNDNANATTNVNADVAGRTGITQRFAYVSMYIVAAGLDPILFTSIHSKPTHINIFRLPDTN